MNISSYSIKKLANHKTSDDVTADYIVSDVERLREPINQITEFIMKHAGLAGYEKAVNLVRMKAGQSQGENSARRAASGARGRVAKVASKKRQKRASK